MMQYDNNLTVCLLNDSFPPCIDGVANTMVNYANIINRDLGHPVVAVPSFPGAIDRYDYPVIRYRSVDTTKFVGYRAGYPFSVKALSSVADEKPDIIHSHCPVMSTAFARTLREQLDIPVVFTYHTKFDIEINHAVRNSLIRKSAVRLLVDNIAACDEVWVVSEGAGESLRSLGYQGDYVVMENGVDFPKGPVSADDSAALRQELGIPEEVPVYLFVGRLMWYKGIKLVLDALAGVKTAGYDYRMVFVGDGMERGEMEAYAQGIGIYDKCIFVGSVQDRYKLRTYFSMSDLFLFPSTYDTYGIVVREAAACGLASVLIENSCAAEGTIHGENAFHIAENAEAMRDLLIHHGLDRNALRKLGENAMDQLYLSWDDSVRRAYQRYGVVLDDFKRGVTDRNFVWTDEVYNWMSDVCQGIENARDFMEDRQRMRRRRRKIRRDRHLDR